MTTFDGKRVRHKYGQLTPANPHGLRPFEPNRHQILTLFRWQSQFTTRLLTLPTQAKIGLLGVGASLNLPSGLDLKKKCFGERLGIQRPEPKRHEKVFTLFRNRLGNPDVRHLFFRGTVSKTFLKLQCVVVSPKSQPICPKILRRVRWGDRAQFPTTLREAIEPEIRIGHRRWIPCERIFSGCSRKEGSGNQQIVKTGRFDLDRQTVLWRPQNSNSILVNLNLFCGDKNLLRLKRQNIPDIISERSQLHTAHHFPCVRFTKKVALDIHHMLNAFDDPRVFGFHRRCCFKKLILEFLGKVNQISSRLTFFVDGNNHIHPSTLRACLQAFLSKPKTGVGKMAGRHHACQKEETRSYFQLTGTPQSTVSLRTDFSRVP